MELEEVLFGISGWIVATLLIVIRIRHDRRHNSELDRLKGLLGRFIEAIEKQRKPLNRLVALGQPGSEVREEAVAALQVANSAVEEVLRAEPQLKADGPASTLDGRSPA
jgi:hypothetical protein